MPPTVSSPPTAEQVTQALAGVNDPEIHRPITELGMVKNIAVGEGGVVRVDIYLTVAGCPLRDTITRDVTAAVSKLPGVARVQVDLDVMSEQQRKELQGKLRGGRPEKEIPFAQPTSLTRVFAIASGKGGVGKSSVTVNLAAALAAAGQKVGVLDADIYGHSVPRMLGVTAPPTQVEQMIMPPTAHGVKVISIGMFTTGNAPVVWRGPMLHRAVQQFLADVYWGDLDVLLMDLPPGTGDVAISVAQLVPGAELIVVTTPQLASSEVAERAGAISVQTHQRITGVIENMSSLACPHCGEPVPVFGSGGGQAVADALTRVTGAPVPLLGQVPIDVRLREGGDRGRPAGARRPGDGGRPAAGRDRERDGEPVARAGGTAAGADPRLNSGRCGAGPWAKEPGAREWSREGSGGLGVEGRGFLTRQRGGGRLAGQVLAVGFRHPGRGAVVAVEPVEQVLADEVTRMQVPHVEVGELGSQTLAEILGRSIRQPTQLTQGMAELVGHLRQLVRPEDHERDHGQDQDLADRQVEKHVSSPGEARPRRQRTVLPSL